MRLAFLAVLSFALRSLGLLTCEAVSKLGPTGHDFKMGLISSALSPTSYDASRIKSSAKSVDEHSKVLVFLCTLYF